MRPGGVRRPFVLGMLCTSLWANGCGTHVPNDPPAAMSTTPRVTNADAKTASDTQPQSADPGPYFNPNGSGDSDGAQNPVLGFFSATGSALGNVAWSIISLPVNAAKWMSGDRPGKSARMMEDATSADNRREGINGLLEYDFTKRDPYTKRYGQIAQYDTDPTVRATAIRALNRARSKGATKILIKALDEPDDASGQPNWLVRLEAAKALANVPDNAAEEPLLRHLNNPDERRDVRIAAADALKHYRTLSVARALVGALNDREFGISWQARKSLKYLFNRDFNYDQAAWLAYISGPQSPVK